jgi:hypothetical protein
MSDTGLINSTKTSSIYWTSGGSSLGDNMDGEESVKIVDRLSIAGQPSVPRPVNPALPPKPPKPSPQQQSSSADVHASPLTPLTLPSSRPTAISKKLASVKVSSTADAVLSQYYNSYKKKCVLVDAIRKCRESASEKNIQLTEEEFRSLLEKFSFKVHRHGTPSQKLSQLASLLRSNSVHYLDSLEDLMTIIGLMLHDYSKLTEMKEPDDNNCTVSQVLHGLQTRLEAVVREIIALKTSIFCTVRHSTKDKREQFVRDHIQSLNTLIHRFSAMNKNFHRYMELADGDVNRSSMNETNSLFHEDLTTVESDSVFSRAPSEEDDRAGVPLPPWCSIDLSSSDLDYMNLSHMNLRHCVFGKDLGRVDLRNCSVTCDQLKFVRNLSACKLDPTLASRLVDERYRLAMDMLQRVSSTYCFYRASSRAVTD